MRAGEVVMPDPAVPGPSSTLMSKILATGGALLQGTLLSRCSPGCLGGRGDPEGCVKPEAD